MKELEILNIIKNTLSKNTHIGDDCAYLKDLGIVITQDSLVEDVHFSRTHASAYEIGYKAIIVNLSDILASGAMPKYLTISLSLPKAIDNNFVADFYKACDDLSKKYDFEVVGGDITGSEKIFISICAIGITQNRNVSSRSNAKIGDLIITTGVHGSSAAGLELLKKENKNFTEIINKHLIPEINAQFSNEIALTCKDYAMMDTSDGLVDALFKIAWASDVSLSIDFSKIPYDKEIETIASQTNNDYKNWIFYGGEDYQLVACLGANELEKLDKSHYTIIGEVKEKNENSFVEININGGILNINDLEKTYNHFERD